MQDDEIHEKLYTIFHQKSMQKTKELLESSVKFVHYTSASTAKSIIENEFIWMRQATVMNDSNEIYYGRKLIYEYMNGSFGKLMKQILDEIFPGFFDEFMVNYSSFTASIQFNTYLTCISEHPSNEDGQGRLSMWRAYAPQNGVAIVLKPGPFLTPSDALGAYTIPVEYIHSDDFHEYVTLFITQIINNKDFLQKINEQMFRNSFINAIKFGICSIKHKSFSEELEWRIVYNPTWEMSQHIQRDIVTLNGCPQIIQKIPLKNFPEKGLVGADLDSILDHIIVGPSQFQHQIGDALAFLLERKGVQEPKQRIRFTSLPLRT